MVRKIFKKYLQLFFSPEACWLTLKMAMLNCSRQQSDFFFSEKIRLNVPCKSSA